MIGQRLLWRPAFVRQRPIVFVDMDSLFGGLVQRLASFVSSWLERRAARRSLQHLDDHTLKDIGLSRCDVERELRAKWSRG
jgi:uncharacterized protein YjiS (DUF1127 family)